MNVVLVGFMATGKSVVGRRVAEALGLSFHDVDETIEKRSGRKVAEIFADDGEKAFRELERQVINEIAQLPNAVVATGGGALLNPKNRATLEKNGVLVCLQARVETLLLRLKSPESRPLLQGEGELSERIERLLNDRKAIYDGCPIQITTDGKSVAQVAHDVVAAVQPRLEKA